MCVSARQSQWAVAAKLLTIQLIAAVSSGIRLLNLLLAVTSHMKDDGHLERNHLAGAEGDAINAILAAAGHNMRHMARWLRLLFALLVAIVLNRIADHKINRVDGLLP